MRVLITGVAGQDGRHLARLLAARGHVLHGMARHAPKDTALRDVVLHLGDVADAAHVGRVAAEVRPEVCYHLAAQHRSSSSLEGEDAQLVMRTNVTGAENILASLQRHAPGCHTVLASSCQVFGEPPTPLQSESTPRDPRTAYAKSKAVAEELGELHRTTHGMHVSTAILFNHESALRPERFVSARIARAAARVARGHDEKLVLGNLDAQVDWMHAQDAVEALRRIVEAPEPGVFVVGTGVLRTVRMMAECAFSFVGRDWRCHVEEDRSLVRRSSALPYAADASLLRRMTGWDVTISFEKLVREMVEFHVQEVS